MGAVIPLPNASKRELIKTTNILGQENTTIKNQPLIEIYDDGSVENAKKYLDTKIKDFPWNKRVLKWFDNWNFLNPNEFSMIGDKSESYGKILEFISKKKSVTKKEILDYMGWGVRIAINPYRNKLRTESNIRFTKNRYRCLENG